MSAQTIESIGEYVRDEGSCLALQSRSNTMKPMAFPAVPFLTLALWISGCSPPDSSERKNQTAKTDNDRQESAVDQRNEPELRGPEQTKPGADDEPSANVEAVKITIDTMPSGYDGKVAFATENKGKWVEITALVYDMGVVVPQRRGDWRPMMVLARLKNGDIPFSPGNVDTDAFMHCLMKEERPWEKSNSGDLVTVRGTPNPGGFLESCSIIASQGEPVPSYTAEEFVTEHDKDPQAFREPFLYGRSVIVSGTVHSYESDGETTFFLGSERRKIELGVAFDQKADFASVTPGVHVTVLSNLATFFGDETTLVRLADCQRIDLVR
jgi:hypothetical protein